MSLSNFVNGFWTLDKSTNALKIRYVDTNRRTHEVLSEIQPYCFVRYADRDKLDLKKYPFLTFEHGDYITLDKEPCVKVSVEQPSDVRELRDKHKDVTFFEADIPFMRRWMLDCNIKIAEAKDQMPLYFDIETDTRKGKRDRTQRILSICAIDFDGAEFTFIDDDEARLIGNFLDLIKLSYTTLLGWGIEDYDLPYLEGRCRSLRLPYQRSSFDYLDLLKAYRLIVRQPSYKLNNVGVYEFGEGKLETFESEAMSTAMWNWFENDRKRLLAYNLQDVKLCKRIDEKYRFRSTRTEIARASNLMLSETSSMSKVVDARLLAESRRMHEKFGRIRTVFPMRPKKDEDEPEFVEGRDLAPDVSEKSEDDNDDTKLIGGLVIAPAVGLHKDVLSLDIVSTYPSIIQAFNIGSDTIDTNGAIQSGGQKFKSDKDIESIFSIAIQSLLKLRLEQKQRMKELKPNTPEYEIASALDLNYKFIVNSYYGVLGSSISRYYNIKTAESITLTARMLLKHAIEYLEQVKGLKALYADTDSCFFKVTTLTAGMEHQALLNGMKSILEDLNDEIQRFARDCGVSWSKSVLLRFEIQDFFSKLLFTAAKKKRYGKAVYSNEKFGDFEVIKGFEMKRSDFIDLTKSIQREIFSSILSAENESEMHEKLRNRLEDFHKKLYVGKLDDSIIFKKTVQREVDSYKTNVMHVNVAKKLENKHRIKVLAGDVVSYVIVDTEKNGKPIPEPVVDISKIPNISKNGYDYVWTHQVIPMVERVFGSKTSKRLLPTTHKSLDLFI